MQKRAAKKVINKTKKKVSKKNVPVVFNIVDDVKMGPTELSLTDMLKDIMSRMTVLEAQEEKRDAIIKLMMDNTLRLVRDKELLLQHLGLMRMSETRSPLKIKECKCR